MTKSINVTVGREVFEITVHLEDEQGRAVPLANNFFRNPNLFQSHTRELLEKLPDRANITQIDTTGIAYRANTQAHTDITRPLWKRVELYVRGGAGAAMLDAEDDELNLSEIDESSDAGSGPTEESFSTVPRQAQSSLISRAGPISLTAPVLHSQAPKTRASHIPNSGITHPGLEQRPILGGPDSDDEELIEHPPLIQTADKISQFKPRSTVRQVAVNREPDEEGTPLLTKIGATVQEDVHSMLDLLLVVFPGSHGQE